MSQANVVKKCWQDGGVAQALSSLWLHVTDWLDSHQPQPVLKMAE